MFECALFGLTNKRINLSNEKPFTRTEKIFKNKDKRAIVQIQKINNRKRVLITFYDTPDRNKQRSAVVCKIQRIEEDRNFLEENYEQFLNEMGYFEVNSNLIEGFRCCRNGFVIETSRLRKKNEIIDSSEEEVFETKENTAAQLYNTYLVKVYSITENVIEGEQILNRAFSELNETVKLIKPNLSVFQ